MIRYTTTINEATKPLHQSPLKQRFSVTFPDTRDKLEAIRQRECMTEEQIHSAWMDAEEYQAVRAEAKKVSNENRDKGHSKLLCPISNPKLAQMQLDLWAKADNEKNMRGLERYVNSQHRHLRDGTARRAIHAVLEAQEKVRESGEKVDFMDCLASVSIQQSAACTQFAQMIAKADERAVHRRVQYRYTLNPCQIREQ
jgi:hypothetical protein